MTPRGTFAVLEYGDLSSPIIVCQHGFPDDASTFDGLAITLAAKGYRVLACNLRGYAPSPLDGSLRLSELVDDLLAIVERLSPDRPVGFIGHDYGAQLAYSALAANPERFSAAVMMSGAHPGLVKRNARRSLKQMWMSRYIAFFQFGKVADKSVTRDDFAYIERLWRRWSPGFELPEQHLARVKRTLSASMPAPIAMYRAGGFDIELRSISVPTLFVCGENDGCALPMMADGQEKIFSSTYKHEVWKSTGHFPHLEQPDRIARACESWFAQHMR